jgi:hypothetical protein
MAQIRESIEDIRRNINYLDDDDFELLTNEHTTVGHDKWRDKLKEEWDRNKTPTESSSDPWATDQTTGYSDEPPF